jgi:hypothetical protein
VYLKNFKETRNRYLKENKFYEMKFTYFFAAQMFVETKVFHMHAKECRNVFSLSFIIS